MNTDNNSNNNDARTNYTSFIGDETIPSMIFSLEKNDLSYSNKKINFKKIIEDSVITIDLNKKKIHNISDKKKIKDNYNKLKNFIDFDEEHYNLLDKDTKNSRYSDISTYEYNHVNLKSKIYINASFVDFPTNQYFIATQGPLPHTINDFWDMIWEYNVNYIVMLCELKEAGREKCAEYWNPDNNSKYDIKINEKKDDNYLVKREFTINKKNNNNNENIKIVNQLHFIGWPDHGIPDVNKVFYTFYKMIKEVKSNKGKGPVVVHCSAGVGRTGTFISMFNIYDEIKKQIEKNIIKVNIFNLVRKLKEMRLFLVENISQYEFIYSFIKLYVEKLFENK